MVGQPPSGSCVLKRDGGLSAEKFAESAAFGRLRVETPVAAAAAPLLTSAAFGRLRVETCYTTTRRRGIDSAAFGRLRVETFLGSAIFRLPEISRLRAAAC